MKRGMGKNGIIIGVVVALIGFYAFTLITDFNQEFEEKELPEITYDVVAEKAESLFGTVVDESAVF